MFVLLAALASATTLTIGEPYRVVDAEERHYFHVGGVIVAVKIDAPEFTIQRFSPDGLTQLSMVRDRDFPYGMDVESIVVLGGKVRVLYSSWDAKAQTEQLFARTIDPATGAFTGPAERILAVEGKVTGRTVARGFAYSFATVDKFAVSLSADGEHMLVRYRRKPTERDDALSYDQIGLAVYGADLSQQWQNELRMPYTEAQMDFWDEGVDGAGNAYILAKVRNGDGSEDRTRDDQPNYHGELFRIGAAGITASQLTIKDKFIHSVALYEAPLHGMAVAGLYNGDGGGNDVEGFFSAALEPGGVAVPTFYEIPPEILKQYASAREARKADEGGGELRSLFLDHVSVDTDGSLTLIAEQFDIQRTTTVQPNGQVVTTVTYLYDDIVAARITTDGLRWVRRIPKHQAGPRNPGGMSYAMFHADGKVHVLYFDNVKNLDLPMDAQPALAMDGVGGYLIAYSIDDATGAAHKEAVLDTRGVEGLDLFQVGVDRIEAVGPSTFVLEAYKRKKEDVLIRVALD